MRVGAGVRLGHGERDAGGAAGDARQPFLLLLATAAGDEDRAGDGRGDDEQELRAALERELLLDGGEAGHAEAAAAELLRQVDAAVALLRKRVPELGRRLARIGAAQHVGGSVAGGDAGHRLPQHPFLVARDERDHRLLSLRRRRCAHGVEPMSRSATARRPGAATFLDRPGWQSHEVLAASGEAGRPGMTDRMTRTHRTRIAALACALVLLATLVAVLAGRAPEPAAAQGDPAAEAPNIVLIESDDQDLRSMQFMPKTNRLLGEKGATFPVQIASWPLCCPARATLFTGQYAHNHGVLGNRDAPLGGFDRFKNETAMPVWLQNAGYYTAHIGKFLNGYEGSAVGVPPGWSEWHGSKDTYTFYGYKLLEDGELVQYGSRDEDPDNPAQPEMYSTDVYTDKAVKLIEDRAPSRVPFFLSLAYLAPHSGAPQPNNDSGPSQCVGTAKPAVRHLGDLASEPIPAPPNFNEADTTDKPNSNAGVVLKNAARAVVLFTSASQYSVASFAMLICCAGKKLMMLPLPGND